MRQNHQPILARLYTIIHFRGRNDDNEGRRRRRRRR